MLFRAKVEDTNDPLNIGRIKVRVYGFHDGIPVEDLPWAEPCFLIGGDKDYGIFAVPSVGSTVWVSFEVDDKFQPDPNCPVWIGAWYGDGESPNETDREKKVVIKTKNKHKIIISDKSGDEGILIQDKNGNKIEIKSDTEQMNISINNELKITSKTKTEEFQQGNLKMDTWQIEGDITLQGNLMVLGNITSTGTTTAQGGLMTNPAGLKLMVDEAITIFNAHTHTGDSGGTTSQPNQQITGG